MMNKRRKHVRNIQNCTLVRSTASITPVFVVATAYINKVSPIPTTKLSMMNTAFAISFMSIIPLPLVWRFSLLPNSRRKNIIPTIPNAIALYSTAMCYLFM